MHSMLPRQAETIEASFNEEIDPPYSDFPKVERSNLETFCTLDIQWRVQIYNAVVKEFGGKSINQNGFNSNTKLPDVAIAEFVPLVIAECGGDAKATAEVLKANIDEHTTLTCATLMHQSFKERGRLTGLTKLNDIITEKNSMSANEKITQSSLHGKKLSMADYDGDKTVKRRKKTPKHIPNMKNKTVKRTMGASILGMLGKVQQDHLDSRKKAVLKELPMADVVEAATGTQLPDWQANLMNQAHAKADPSAPVVKRMSESEQRGFQPTDEFGNPI